MVKILVVFAIMICSALFVKAEQVYRIMEVIDKNGNKNWIPVLVDDNTWKK